MKGWIALDIDGTVTNDLHRIPDEVTSYLATLSDSGWQILFITGRAFLTAYPLLQKLSFPYFLAVQNGADLISMPERRLIRRLYLDQSILPLLETIYTNCAEDFLVYGGYDRGDICYYRPHRFSDTVGPYLEKLKGGFSSKWVQVDHFNFPEIATFPVIKCFGVEKEMQGVAEMIQKETRCHATTIHDRFSGRFHLTMITHIEATKGEALQAAVGRHNSFPIIAAGDDFNDETMLDIADLRIVIRTAPEAMHKKAHILADSAAECGIIGALKQAVLQV